MCGKAISDRISEENVTASTSETAAVVPLSYTSDFVSVSEFQYDDCIIIHNSLQ